MLTRRLSGPPSRPRRNLLLHHLEPALTALALGGGVELFAGALEAFGSVPGFPVLARLPSADDDTRARLVRWDKQLQRNPARLSLSFSGALVIGAFPGIFLSRTYHR